MDSFESSHWYPHTGSDREKDKEKHGLNGETFLLCFFEDSFRLFLPVIDFSRYLLSSVTFVDLFIPTTAIFSEPVLFSFVLKLYYFILKAVPLLLVYPFYCAV